MGRGQQMNNWDMEKSVVDTSREDCFRCMNKRRVFVALLAFLLPVLITSSYMYYSTPDASTEAMMFFQKRPFLSSFSLKEDTNTSVFGSDTSGSDSLQVEPKTEDTENTSDDSLGADPVEGNTEVPSDGMAEDVEEQMVDPSETDISASSTLGLSEQEHANTTITELENSTTLEVNATTVESDASKQKAPDDSSNNHQSKIEDSESTTDSLGAKPVEGSREADAMAENQEEKMVNSTSQDLDATAVESDTTKDLKTPDENPNNHRKSEPSVIAMESHKKGVCDLVKGSWVPDSRPPQYTNATCAHIQSQQNCMKNGRPDTGFLYWKWKPEQCELPRIDAAAFLNTMRDKFMYFVGDSLARNQFQSLLCLLSQGEKPDHIYQSADDKNNVHVFRSHNFTLAVHWSTHLVHVEYKQVTWPDNSTDEVAHIHLDKLDKAWTERVPGVDIIQISTGQWWFKRALFHLGGQPIGAHWYGNPTCEAWKECPKTIGFADPYRMAMHNALQGSLSIPGYTGTTVLRSFSPDHFEDGQWDTSGQCVRTNPGGVPIRDLTKWMYDIQTQVFQNVTDALSASDKKRIRLLDITNLAQIRADGHPDAYRNFQPFSKESKQPVQKDCLHWCLPGPIDTWNNLLVETLLQCRSCVLLHQFRHPVIRETFTP